MKTIEKWNDNNIQFPRLLHEVDAILRKQDRQNLAKAMGLEVSDIQELFDRANNAFEQIKKDLFTK